MMKLLEKKVAIVTGGSRGIGEAIVRKLAEHGANVAFTYLASAEKAEKIVSDIASLGGGQAKAYRSDASSYEEAEELVNQVVADFGKVDVLVNNAGVTRDNLLLRMSETQWDEVMHVNLKSIFNTSKHILKTMMKNKGGSIINLTSIVGINGNAGQSNYAASKAGIIGFTQSLAQEMGKRGIRCNAIAPGFIETDMTHGLDEATKAKYLENIPLNRLGRAEEVANTVLFLASDLSSYVSGQTLSVCGALT